MTGRIPPSLGAAVFIVLGFWFVAWSVTELVCLSWQSRIDKRLQAVLESDRQRVEAFKNKIEVSHVEIMDAETIPGCRDEGFPEPCQNRYDDMVTYHLKNPYAEARRVDEARAKHQAEERARLERVKNHQESTDAALQEILSQLQLLTAELRFQHEQRRYSVYIGSSPFRGENFYRRK